MENLEGLLFSILWASATVATKFAVRSADPFLLTCSRFLVVAILLHIYLYFYQKKDRRLPRPAEFKKLLLLGILSITLYMSGFLIAVQTVSAGLISITSAGNPLILISMSAVILKRKLTAYEFTGILVAITGLVLAALPALRNSHGTLKGLAALIMGMMSLSAGSIYFSKSKFQFSRMAVNAWQITFGGLLFIPIVLLNNKPIYIKPDGNFFISFLWLVIPVSIIAYALWLKLLERDPVKAGMWLFVTPALGYLIAVIVLKEKLTLYGASGAVLVVSGLLYSKRTKKKAALA